MPTTTHEGPSHHVEHEREMATARQTFIDATEAQRRLLEQFIPRETVFSGHVVLDASGVWDTTFRSTIRSCFVANLTGATIVVHGAPRGASAPSGGQGVTKVPALSAMVINVATSALALYGTAGGGVDLQAFSHRLTPAASSIADNVKTDTATMTSPTPAIASAVVVPQNLGRRALLATNSGTGTLYLAYGPVASPTAFTVAVAPGGYWEMPVPIYTGVVSGVWSAVGGTAQFTEQAV